jgi:DNA-binding transcriptional ArsR family regulator
MQAKKGKKMSGLQIEEAARLFGSLSEPSRLHLLQTLLTEGPQTVTQLTETTGFKQANVSKHLAILFQHRLVARDRQGTSVVYRLSDPFIAQLCELVCHRISKTAATHMKELASLT